MSSTLHDLLTDVVDATDRGNNPNVVADAHLTVGAEKALEGEGGKRRRRRWEASRTNMVIRKETREIGGKVGMVNKCALGNVRQYMTDGEPVLDDVLASGNVAEGNLVASRDAGEVLQSHGHGISRMYLEGS